MMLDGWCWKEAWGSPIWVHASSKGVHCSLLLLRWLPRRMWNWVCGRQSFFGWHFWQYHLNNAHSRISELKRIQRKALRQSSSSSILIMIKQKHLYVDSLISEPIGLVIIAVMLLIYTTHLEKEFKKDQMWSMALLAKQYRRIGSNVLIFWCWTDKKDYKRLAPSHPLGPNRHIWSHKRSANIQYKFLHTRFIDVTEVGIRGSIKRMKEKNLCHKVIANFQEQHVCLLKIEKKAKRMTMDEEAAIVDRFTFLPDN